MRHLGFRYSWQTKLITFQKVSRPRLQRCFQAVAYTDTDSQYSSKAPSALSSTDLYRAAQLARLSGFCYYPPDQLEKKLEKEGMQLVTSGSTDFTRWYIADGCLGGNPQRPSDSSSEADKRLQSETMASTSSQPISMHARTGEIERIFMLRGVVWGGEGVDTFKLWQDIMRFWPTPLAREHTQPPGLLLAHAGAASMAERLYDTLKVAVQESVALDRRMTFGGHSLGGTLALALTSLFRLRFNVPAHLLKVTTFGSPPVLSHKHSRGGDGILKVLGMKRSAIRSYVLENDPVPRALLSIDPNFTALKQTRVGSAFLQLRQMFMGSTTLTPDRFIADNVGEVHLIKWNAEDGHQVTALAAEEIEAELLEAANRAASSFQRVVDHAHGSYSTDLNAAAWQLQMKGQ